MAQHGHLTREEKKKIRIERKKLRKDLKLKGITKRKDFEEIAQMLGLVYGDDYPALLWLWWRFTRFLGRLGAAFWFRTAIFVLALVTPFAILANQKGNFLVTLTTELMQVGFELSEDEAFTKPKTKLASEVLTEVNAYSMADLPDNLNDINGSHNMDNVIAYTFWIANNGKKATGYDWYLVLNNSTKKVDKATWLMVYDENKMVVYAEKRKDGTPEQTDNYLEPPLRDQAANPDQQYKQADDESWSVVTTPYEKKHIVASGTEKTLQPGEKHKYTVVIWIEGDDPDCTEELIGGHAGYAMRFTTIGDKDEINEKYGYEDEKTTELRDKNQTIVDKFINRMKKKETTTQTK